MYQSLQMQPGINTELSPSLNETGFSFSQNIRFFSGMAQKLGGWQHLTPQPFVGVGRGMHAWADLNGNPYAAIGTDQRLQVYYGGAINDITPGRLTTTPVVNFSTQAGSTTITYVDPGNGASVGDWINFGVPIAVGGIILAGYYRITATPDVNTNQFQAAQAATITVNNYGLVPTFQTSAGSPFVTVYFPYNQFVVGSGFTVQVQTTISTVVLLGLYPVTRIIDANTFQIQPGTVALANAGPVAENGGLAQIQYFILSGLASAVISQGGGYGVGPYGAGPYGVGYSGTVVLPLRQWFLDNFGQDLVGNYNGSPIYVWYLPWGRRPPCRSRRQTFRERSRRPFRSMCRLCRHRRRWLSRSAATASEPVFSTLCSSAGVTPATSRTGFPPSPIWPAPSASRPVPASSAGSAGRISTCCGPMSTCT